MSSLAATLRLRFRRDRLQLIVWVIAFFALIAATAQELNTVYATAADRETVVRLAVTNTSLLLARGAPQGTSLGEMVSFQILAFAALLAGIMTSMLAVRHIRGDEESGRAELVGASRAGRTTPAVATLLEGVVAAVGIGLATAVGLLAAGLPPSGCLALGAGCTVCALAFLGVGLVAAQLFSTSRTANGVGIALVCVSWVVRGIGDMTGTPAPDGLSASIGWASWLSPIGWAQLMRPFGANDYLPALVGLLVAAALVALALALQSARDLGAGLVPARTGRAGAPRTLAGPIGLAWRLQRGSLYGWGVGAILLAIFAAELAPQTLKDLQSSGSGLGGVIKDLLPGGAGAMIDLFISALAGFFGLVVTGGALQTIMRLRQEESAGHAETILATRVGRLRWLGSFVALAVGATVLIALVGGLLAGATGVKAGDPGDLGKWLAACLAQVPAVVVYLSLLTLIFAAVPRWTVGLGWALFGVGGFIGEFGGLMNLPAWMRDLAPSSHTPIVPAAGASWTGAWWMLAISAVALVAAGVLFRRRDLAGQ
jgi:ABC-2 type transport system permease protein